MKESEVSELARSVVDKFRVECATPSGADINASHRDGFRAGVNALMRAVVTKLRNEANR